MKKHEAKEKDIHVRITSQRKKIIERLQGCYTTIFDIGFNEWIKNYPAEQNKLAEYYKEMWTQCIHKSKECGYIVSTEIVNKDLDESCIFFIKYCKQRYFTIPKTIEQLSHDQLDVIQNQIKKHILGVDKVGYLYRVNEILKKGSEAPSH